MYIDNDTTRGNTIQYTMMPHLGRYKTDKGKKREKTHLLLTKTQNIFTLTTKNYEIQSLVSPGAQVNKSPDSQQ